MSVLQVGLERSPPAVVAADDGALPEDVLQPGDQTVHTGQVSLSERPAVDLPGPEGVVELGVELEPLPEVALSRQQQGGVELLDDPGPAEDPAGEESSGHSDDQRLVERAPAQSLVHTHHSQSGPGRAQSSTNSCLAGLAGLRVEKAGEEGAPPRLPPPLVQPQPGGEPGELEEVNTGQGQGGAHTEGLEARHLLTGQTNCYLGLLIIVMPVTAVTYPTKTRLIRLFSSESDFVTSLYHYPVD